VSKQLDALRDVAAAFERSGIDYWLFGGWAVDFHAGAVTREHDDVDVAIWLDDMARITPLLEAEGWRDLQDPDTDGGVAFGRGDVRLELTYLYQDDDGEIYTPLLDGTRGRWTTDSLGGDVKTLEEVTARVVSLGPLTRMKERGREDPEDAAKDRADFERLSGL
jgi:Aminoglycoside-2''-adenylyltransferase